MEQMIETSIELNAPLSRVWRALTDYQQFGEWFLVKLENPFVPGQATSGYITHPGYEHIRMEVVVQALEPEHTFSYTWHPFAVDPTVDYSGEPCTLVEFKLQPSAAGTLVTLRESGFEKLPPERRSICLRMNEGGWRQQMLNIEAYVAKNA